MNEKKQTRYVEIKGIGFPNRGAELLLVATLQELNKRGLRAAIEPYSPYDYKVQYPLYTKACIRIHGFNILAPLGLLPKYARERLGILKPSEISFALDASGYAYGDPWSSKLANARVLRDSPNINVFLLPQSLGPFDKKSSQNTATKLVKRASKIYAREHLGARYLSDATGHSPQVVPDITFGLHVEPSATKRDVIFIPNFQVLKLRGEEYIELLILMAKQLVEQGRTVAFLNHEGSKDLEICRKAITALKKQKVVCELIRPKDGTNAKQIIGASNFVLTSRYHGLISALSQSIPVACLGWSYKYDAALTLFDIPHYDFFENPHELSKIVCSQKYCGHFGTPEYTQNLVTIQQSINDMWEEVLGPKCS